MDVVIYSSSNFFYNKDSRIFTASISKVPSILRQLSEESMDLGFGIQSEKTGVIILYKLINMQRDCDGKIISWHYDPSAFSTLTHSGCHGTHAIILNK